MKSYFDEAEFYANENYSNAGGEWSNFDSYDYFDNYNYASGGGHSNANPAASLPFILNIANSTTADVAGVSILGANVNINAANQGNVAAITITMDNGTVTYIQFLQSIISEPFRVTVIRHMFPVNANTSISTTILGSATLTLRLYPSEVLDISRSLTGMSANKNFASPTGIMNQAAAVGSGS